MKNITQAVAAPANAVSTDTGSRGRYTVSGKIGRKITKCLDGIESSLEGGVHRGDLGKAIRELQSIEGLLSR
jgi:hypothetical protein